MERQELTVRALGAYRDIDSAGRVEAASGAGGLVVVMLDELIDRIDAVAGAIAARQTLRRNRESARALSVLAALAQSLDERVGTMAVNLAASYAAIGVQLRGAIAENDPKRCHLARDLTLPIAEAWRAIA